MQNHLNTRAYLREQRERIVSANHLPIGACHDRRFRSRLAKRDRFRALLDHASDAVFLLEADSARVVDANHAAFTLTGLSREELTARTFREFVPDAACPRLDRRVKGAWPDGRENHIVECAFRGGSSVLMEMSVRLIVHDGHDYLVVVARDISERRAPDARLRESEQKLRTILETANDGFWELDNGGRTVNVNSALCAMLGRSREDILGRRVADFLDARGREIFAAQLRKREAGLSGKYELSFLRSDSSLVHCLVKGTPLFSGQCGKVGSFAIIADITEQKNAQEARVAHVRFLESLEQIERAIRQATDLQRMQSDILDVLLAVFQCDRAWLLHPCDPAAPSWRIPMERSRAEYPGAAREADDTFMAADVAELLRAALATNYPVVFGASAPMPLPTDALRFGVRSQMCIAVRPQVGSPWLLGIHQCTDLREWSFEEQRLLLEISRRVADGLSSMLILHDLRESEQRFKSLLTNIPSAVFRCANDEEWTILFVSERIADFLGFRPSDLIEGRSRGGAALIHPDDRNAVRTLVREKLASGQSASVECRLLTADGSFCWVEIRCQGVLDYHGALAFLDGVVVDISARKKAETEKEKLESQLNQIRKMDAVGQLAGGVAHDFNNILTAILGHVELSISSLSRERSKDSDTLEHLRQIEHAGNSAAELTRQLLQFSRRGAVQPETLDLNQVIANLEKLLRRLIRENVTLQIAYGGEIDSIRAGTTQIEQIIINLAVNASDAMPNGGELILRIGNVTIDQDYVDMHAEATVGRHVMLTVSDTGVGIEPKVMERIFEPFFTTKGAGIGTGLGLATVYGIVKQSGGHIAVYSEVGKGTTFRIFLPAVEPAPSKSRSSSLEDYFPAGTETILVCEDNESVRRLACQFLSAAGYEVLVASNGHDACNLAADRGEPIDLLLTDVIMPGMNGRQLAGVLIEKRPRMRTLYISGYTSNVIAHHGVLDDGVEFLEKPFSRANLLRKVREVLDAPETR
jgi:PAS domain S-box-containing protein